MSKFNGNSIDNDLTSGQTDAFLQSLRINNLVANFPLRTNANKALVSEKIQLSDIEGTLLTNPYVGTIEATDFKTNTYASVNTKLGKTINITDAIANTSTSIIGDILPSTHNAYDLGEGGTAFRDIYANRLLSQNGLTSLTIANNNTSTFTGTVEANILKKVGGTNIQYLMADGSSLTQSASSGNSNFYLYKIDTSMTTTPASGFVSFNNVTQSLATIIYISHQTSDGIDVEVFF